MLPPSQHLFLWTSPLVALGWGVVAFSDPDTAAEESLFLGTMLSHTTVAAAWAALGPGRLLARQAISFLWVVMLAAAVAVNIGIVAGPGMEEFAAWFGCCLVGQWLLVQLPLWLLIMLYRLKLLHRDLAGVGSDPRAWQFGIRQLMILTALVAVVLGAGRFLWAAYGERIVEAGPNLQILAFLVAAAVVLSLPPLLAALLPRYSVWVTLATLVAVGLATACEASLSRQFGLGPSPNLGDFIAVNAITIAWVLAFAIAVRRNGYLLGTPQARAVTALVPGQQE